MPGRLAVMAAIPSVSGLAMAMEARPVVGGAATAAPVMLDVFSLLGHRLACSSLDELNTVQVCVDDGYLAGNADRTGYAPRLVFRSVTPHHLRIHLDANGQRVHGNCEAVANMQHRDWFVLPPAQPGFIGGSTLITGRYRHGAGV